MNIDQYCQRQRCKHVEFEQFLTCFRVARVSAIAGLSCSKSGVLRPTTGSSGPKVNAICTVARRTHNCMWTLNSRLMHCTCDLGRPTLTSGVVKASIMELDPANTSWWCINVYNAAWTQFEHISTSSTQPDNTVTHQHKLESVQRVAKLSFCSEKKWFRTAYAETN